jgi:hypothetical protein
MTDLEDIMVPAILGLLIGPSGWFLIHASVLSANMASWTFTGAYIARAICPFIEWIWLVNCVFIAGYQFLENR